MWRTLDRIETEPSGECEMIPAPSLFAEPSRPRAYSVRDGGGRGSSAAGRRDGIVAWCGAWKEEVGYLVRSVESPRVQIDIVRTSRVFLAFRSSRPPRRKQQIRSHQAMARLDRRINFDAVPWVIKVRCVLTRLPENEI